jgi:hypothetical protein
MNNCTRIAMWSGPRNLSTAMMRSFGSRADTVVSDEPFYGAYLKDTGDDQPMREEVIQSMNCDWHSIALSLSDTPPNNKAIWYQKHMVHHMVGPLDYDDLKNMQHAFLIRDPARVVASYSVKREAVEAHHLGVEKQAEYFKREADRLGYAPPVIDSADVLSNPENILSKLCEQLDIPWDASMLKWEKGRCDTDGIWASHWYHSVEGSTGFGAPDTKEIFLSDDEKRVSDICMPFYNYLAEHKITG